MSEKRRITRSISSEQRARLAKHAHQPHNPHHNYQNGYAKGLSGLINEAENSMKDPQFTVFRNTTEEMLITSLVDGIPTPSMEGIGFTNVPQANRIDSEELFHSWMCHGESQNGPIQGQNRARQPSRRISTEVASLLSHQQHQSFNRVDSFEHFLQTNNFFLEDAAGENRARDTGKEKGANTVGPNSIKSIPWFSHNRPMTRSHSSELRRHYAAMQGKAFPQATDQTFQMPKNPATQGTSAVGPVMRQLNQIPPSFPQVTQSAMAPLHLPLGGESVSSFVTLLKSTLERKKMGKGFQQQWRRHVVSESLPPHQKVDDNLQNRVEDSMDQVQTITKQIILDGHMAQMGTAGNGFNHNHPGFLTTTHAPSPSGSSAGAPVMSTGEEPCNSSQTHPLKRSVQQDVDVDQKPKRQNSISTQHTLDNVDIVRDIAQIGDHTRSPHLTRVGSVTSSGGSGIGLFKDDPTKKRRVERQRKMAEAKGRNGLPVLPSDLQATLKRCDALEKEVRSLKLNLAFMNRKDSEQTKQIEELQKQNEDLQEEKEKLQEEMEQLTGGGAGAR